MADKIFANGLIFKKSDSAPSYVIGSLSVRVNEFVPFLQDQGGEWVNLSIKESKGGKYYIELDTWKSKEKKEGATGRKSSSYVAPEDADSGDLPF